MTNVLKFGASTLGTVPRFREVAALTGRSGKILAVLSAPSALSERLQEVSARLRERDTEGARLAVGRLVEACSGFAGELFPAGDSQEKACAYLQELRAWLVSLPLEPFREATEKLVLAQGELLTTYLMGLCLAEQGIQAHSVPAFSFLRGDAHGQPDMDHLRTTLPALLAEAPDADVYLTQGFLCMNSRGEADRLGPDGGDLSACLIGAALGSEEIRIRTSAEGRDAGGAQIVLGNTPVGHLHYGEAAELAYFGARMPHPASILPAREAGIPVVLADLADPLDGGIRIDGVLEHCSIKAVAAKSQITAIRIQSSRMLLAHGFLRRVFEVFEGYRTAIDMICTSEIGVSLTIDDDRYLPEILRDLQRYGAVDVDRDMCIVCVVGDIDWGRPGTVSRVMEALEGIPVRMVSYGGSPFNLSLLVRAEDRSETLRLLGEMLGNHA